MADRDSTSAPLERALRQLQRALMFALFAFTTAVLLVGAL